MSASHIPWKSHQSAYHKNKEPTDIAVAICQLIDEQVFVVHTVCRALIREGWETYVHTRQALFVQKTPTHERLGFKL